MALTHKCTGMLDHSTILLDVYFQTSDLARQTLLYINYQLDAMTIILFIKYYSPLHVSSIKC